jgi:hypothetical protein
MKGHHLSETAYAEALQGMVIVCTDVLIVDLSRETVFLATRRSFPMRGLWGIGGRVRAGETEWQAICRIFRRETSLDLAPERFERVPLMARYMWSEREQDHVEMGADNLSYNFLVPLSEREIKEASSGLDPDEYEAAAGLREFSSVQLRDFCLKGAIHPAIVDIYRAGVGSL